MIPEELAATIRADMRRAAGMEFREMAGFLANYTGSLNLWQCPGVAVEQVRRFADAELDRARGSLQ